MTPQRTDRLRFDEEGGHRSIRSQGDCVAAQSCCAGPVRATVSMLLAWSYIAQCVLFGSDAVGEPLDHVVSTVPINMPQITTAPRRRRSDSRISGAYLRMWSGVNVDRIFGETGPFDIAAEKEAGRFLSTPPSLRNRPVAASLDHELLPHHHSIEVSITTLASRAPEPSFVEMGTAVRRVARSSRVFHIVHPRLRRC